MDKKKKTFEEILNNIRKNGKTVPCRDAVDMYGEWTENRCARDICFYAHSFEELRPPNKLCRFGDRCNHKETCRFVHPGQEIEPYEPPADYVEKLRKEMLKFEE